MWRWKFSLHNFQIVFKFSFDNVEKCSIFTLITFATGLTKTCGEQRARLQRWMGAKMKWRTCGWSWKIVCRLWEARRENSFLIASLLNQKKNELLIRSRSLLSSLFNITHIKTPISSNMCIHVQQLKSWVSSSEKNLYKELF